MASQINRVCFGYDCFYLYVYVVILGSNDLEDGHNIDFSGGHDMYSTFLVKFILLIFNNL